MGALTCKRDTESQSTFCYDHPHISKKLKSSSFIMGPTKNPVSRLSLYPKQVTPIKREIQAPITVVTGFNNNNNNSTSKRLDTSTSFSKQQKSDLSGDRMGNLLSNYYRAKEDAKGCCRFVNFEVEDEVIEVVNVDDGVKTTVNDDGSGDYSGVDEVVSEKDVNKLGELENIREKYRELDGKVEGKENLATCSGVVSDLMDGKGLEALSLEPRMGVSVSVGLPYHKRLLIDSAQKRDSRLQRLSFDIKLQEEKRALLKQLTPVKKVEPSKDEDVLLEPFRPLTEDDEEMVAGALSNSSRRKVLVTHENSNITITGEVLWCLRPRAWLNDEVINLYLELLKEREKKEPKKFLKCHFFSTFFYKKLISGRTGYDYKSVRRWTTQRKLGYSLLECDKIFVPVHKEIHWCLAVINKKEEKFQYLDSLGGVDKQVMRVLAKYFVDEVKDKNGEDIDVSSWQQEYVTDLPNQENGFDCGVFMIKYADFYSRDIGLCFKQEHMPYFRKRTAMEILKLRAD